MTYRSETRDTNNVVRERVKFDQVRASTVASLYGRSVFRPKKAVNVNNSPNRCKCVGLDIKATSPPNLRKKIEKKFQLL